MLAPNENLAIHLALIFALPPEKAASITGASEQPVANALLRLAPQIRGRTVPFADYLAEKPLPQHDSFRLNKEIRLAQLQHLHDECLRSWTITVDHAAKLAEHHKAVPLADGAPLPKPFVGDLRFLQMAKSLRKEMDQVEKAIARHLEQLAEEGQTSSVTAHSPVSAYSSTVQQPPAPAKTTSAQSTGAPPTSAPVTISPPVESKALPPASLPSRTAARMTSPQAADKPASPTAMVQSPGRKPIPVIPNPPPRRVNKYAGLDR